MDGGLTLTHTLLTHWISYTLPKPTRDTIVRQTRWVAPRPTPDTVSLTHPHVRPRVPGLVNTSKYVVVSERLILTTGEPSVSTCFSWFSGLLGPTVNGDVKKI